MQSGARVEVDPDPPVCELSSQAEVADPSRASKEVAEHNRETAALPPETTRKTRHRKARKRPRKKQLPDVQTWYILFGNEEDEDQCVKLQDVRLQELREGRSGSYIYEKLTEVAPLPLYPASHYVLDYRLPGWLFTTRIGLDNQSSLERAFLQFAEVPPKHWKKLTFRVAPKEDEDEMWMPVNEEDSVSSALGSSSMGDAQTLADKTRLLRFLGYQHLTGHIDIRALKLILAGRREDLNRGAYFLLPHKEKPRHQYLLPRKGDPKEGKSPEQLYHEKQITLLQYDDLKYPERKAARDAAQATHPLPEPLYECVVCRQPEKANIQCLQCHKRVCHSCLAEVFPTSGDDAFLTMHIRFCMGFGRPVRHKLPPIASL